MGLQESLFLEEKRNGFFQKHSYRRDSEPKLGSSFSGPSRKEGVLGAGTRTNHELPRAYMDTHFFIIVLSFY